MKMMSHTPDTRSKNHSVVTNDGRIVLVKIMCLCSSVFILQVFEWKISTWCKNMGLTFIFRVCVSF